MWSTLQEEELRRDLVNCKLDGSSESGSKSPEEEENAALASKGQQGQQRQKRDVSKVKCFRCGEMGHFASQCPLNKKDKDEKDNPKVTAVKIEQDEFAMSAHASPGEKWSDIEL